MDSAARDLGSSYSNDSYVFSTFLVAKLNGAMLDRLESVLAVRPAASDLSRRTTPTRR